MYIYALTTTRINNKTTHYMQNSSKNTYSCRISAASTKTTTTLISKTRKKNIHKKTIIV